MKSVLEPVKAALKKRMTISRQPLQIGRRPTLLDRLHRGFVRTMFGVTVVAITLCGYEAIRVFFLPSSDKSVAAAGVPDERTTATAADESTTATPADKKP